MPKDVKVFISSTCKDLKQDCRCRAIETIERTAGAEPIAMERWYADYGHTVEMCLGKLRDESTHFLGIFAYRYGWRPDGPGAPSITEKEFDLAFSLKRKMFILTPEEGSPIYTELWQRAADQSEEDKKAQLAFLARVGSRVCRPFKDVADLVSWVTHKIRDWQSEEGGLRAIAAARPRVAAPPPATLAKLGRVAQMQQFENCLRNQVSTIAPAVACFLVHGPAGYGHEELLGRLQQNLSSDGEALSCLIDAGAAWRSKDLSALLEVIGKELDEKFATIAQLAARLKQELTKLDVVLRFENLQRLNVTLADFITAFWQPLAQSFTADDDELPHRLIGLAGFKGALDAACEPYLFYPGGAYEFASTSLIALPELDVFSELDLLVWLKDRGVVPHARAKDLAQRLFRETQGNPPALF
jgi:hypothetical protein